MQFDLPLTMSFFFSSPQPTSEAETCQRTSRISVQLGVQYQSSCVDLKSCDSLYTTRHDINPASPLTDVFHGNHTMSASVKWISCLFYFKSITLQGTAAHNIVYLETDFGGLVCLSICPSVSPPHTPSPTKPCWPPLLNESYSGVWSLYFRCIYNIYIDRMYIYIYLHPQTLLILLIFFKCFLNWVIMCLVCMCVWMCGFLFRKQLFF